MQSELREWQKNPPEGCRLFDSDDLSRWVIEMEGPESSPGPTALYAGQVFLLRCTFCDEYPLEPPEVVFVEGPGVSIPLHPHIYSNGSICLDILYTHGGGGWSPALTVSKVALSLRSMLASNLVLEGPPDDEEYCRLSKGKSPKETRWDFHDDSV